MSKKILNNIRSAEVYVKISGVKSGIGVGLAFAAICGGTEQETVKDICIGK